jgi:hypothetical protein
MALRIKFSVDIENGLFTSLLVEDDRSIAGSNDFLLVLYFSYKCVN